VVPAAGDALPRHRQSEPQPDDALGTESGTTKEGYENLLISKNRL